MATWEDLIRKKMGVPVENAAGEVGSVVDNLYEKMKALGQLGGLRDQQVKQKLDENPPAVEQSANVLENLLRQQKQEKAIKKNQEQDIQQQKLENSLEEPMDERGYNKYAGGGTVQDPDLHKPNFSHLKDLQDNHKKAMSELEASRNPMKFIKDNKNMSIKGKKGIAF